MNLPRLELPRCLPDNAGDIGFLFQSLRDSGCFEVVACDLPPLPRGRRWAKNFALFRLEGALLGLDTWDKETPSALAPPLLAQLDLLLKIQYRPNAYWDAMQQRLGVPIRAWTMFGYAPFPPGYFRWEPGPKRHAYVFSGHAKLAKHRWIEHLRRRGAPVFGKQKPEEYLPLTRELTWGLILQGRKGRYCDGKNRREHAYTSCGMPLALNYQPYYPTPMRPGIDYVYLAEPADIDRLADIDPTPYAAASRRLWGELFSPQAMARQLMRLLGSGERS